jgi:hypothetical protein
MASINQLGELTEKPTHPPAALPRSLLFTPQFLVLSLQYACVLIQINWLQSNNQEVDN